MPKVVFPCDLDNWWRVKDQLHTLKENCQERADFDLKAIAEAHQKILDVYQGILVTEHVGWGDTVFCGLIKFFRKHAAAEERSQFIKITFPSIVDLALEVEALLPTDGIDISVQQKGETRKIDRHLCCSIVACSFLCLFPDDNRGRGTKLNHINFTSFFANLPIPSQNAKLRCILHFFDRVAAEKNRLTGAILFTRQVIKKEELPTLDTWLNCRSELCQLIVQEDGVIEDAGCNTVEVDFANRFIGGGVLGRGRVQEEIRFTVCPELIVSMLFMEVMEENEAIVVQGYEQFSATQGYASDLKFVGEYRDQSEADEHGNRKTMLCAINAISYKHDQGIYPERQYLDHSILRDINKAFTGFCTPFSLPRGVSCARSVSEESYVTAHDESNTRSEEGDGRALRCSQKMDVFIEELLQGAFSLALTDATKLNSSRVEHHETPSSVGEHYLQRQSSMDHLEVNFRDWYANYRRRSSNLSDLSSRRSSYDLASRRSSGCSVRGYSSEYSSEFEEYYDNFQQQEQKYKYHTIKEEVGSSVVIEFASSLAASLLREGAQEASGFVPREFIGKQPNCGLHRPLPVRISTTSLSTLDSVENEEAIAREDYIRQYVDRMFESIWPLCDDELESESQVQSYIEFKERILMERNANRYRNVNNSENSEDETESVVCDKNMVDKRDSTDMSNEFDEALLFAVADRLVVIAFQEALLDYRFLITNSGRHMVHHISSLSESSQSDHSIDSKDQSDASKPEINQLKTCSKSPSSNMDPAVMVAEKMVSGIFSDKDSGLPSNIAPETDFQNRNIPKSEICDINLLLVDSSISKSHSSSSNDSELSASKRREMYSRLADKVLSGGFTTNSNNEERQSCNDIITSSLNLSSDASLSDSSVGRQLSNSANCDYNADSSRDKPRNLAKWEEKPLKSSSNDSKSSYSISYDSYSEPKPSSSVSQVSTENNDKSKLNVRLSGEKHPQNLDATCQDGYQSVEHNGGFKPKSGNKTNKSHHIPTAQTRLTIKKGCYYVAGNKKNYDQFANSLSRDLLTNAFLQVQEHSEPVAYPRRSSEPIQISNGVALQRYEHSLHTINGKRSQKSKTDEDIPQFECDWMQQFRMRSSSGFRDPVLSRFAEELMKANVSVPSLQLPYSADAISISGSSQSVCSTLSSFRDPLLASFEDELWISNDKRSAKTQTSWSRSRGSMCSPRLSGNSTSSSSRESKKQVGVSMSMDSEISGMSNRSGNALCVKTVSEYAEILSRRIMCEVLTVVYSAAPNSGDSDGERVLLAVNLYSDMLARSILQSALVTAEMMHSDWFDQNKVVTWSDETEVHYSEDDNLDSSDLDNSRDRVPSCSESGQSSNDYQDALDIPYQRLEEFADVLASKVLINSVAISRRETVCSLRRQYGRPIATGNWGCGAFGGDPHLKSLLQWMAASYAGCPYMLYYTFQSPQMDKLQEVVNIILERGWDVSKLMQVVRRYCIIAQNEINEHGYITRELFDIILQGEVFPGV